VTLTALYWWDLRRGSGEYEPGNSDEITAGPRVKKWDDLEHIPFVPVTILSEYCTQGVAHGMAYNAAGDDVVRGDGDRSDGTGLDYLLLYQDGDDWVECGSFVPNPAGRWVTPPAPEKDRTYGVQAPGQSVVSIGEFANRELAIQALRVVEETAGSQPALAFHALTGMVHLAWNSEQDICYTSSDESWTGWRYGDKAPVAGTVQKTYVWQEQDHDNPSIVLLPTGELIVTARRVSTKAVEARRSYDYGLTWQEV
jgi:hypothetical protein